MTTTENSLSPSLLESDSIDSTDPYYDYNQGLRFFQEKKFQTALESLRRATAIKSDFAEAQFYLGATLLQMGDSAAALQAFLKTVQLQPQNADAYCNLGACFSAQREYTQAVQCYQKALELRPDSFTGNNNLAALLLGFEKPEQAQIYFERALRVQPNAGIAQNNLAKCLVQLGMIPRAAVERFCQVLGLSSRDATAHTILGTAYLQAGKYEYAEASYKKALQLEPGRSSARVNLGILYYKLGQYESSLSQFEKVLDREPENPEAHFHRGCVRLLKGNFKEGWEDYVWLGKWKDFLDTRGKPFSQPEWDGSSFAGKTLLLHSQEGFGDTLQLIRYASLVKQGGGTVLFECRKELFRLFENVAGVDRLISRGEALPAFDLQAPLHILPQLFKTDLDSIPADCPYLPRNFSLNSETQQALGGVRVFKVGFVWQGNPGHADDRRRSMRLEHFRELSQIPGVQLFSLQKNHGIEQLALLQDEMKLIDLGKTCHDFVATAAAVQELDLVISIDSSVAHLAGALNKPVWVLLPKFPEWRWMLNRSDSPWYPSMKLFRQAKEGDWAELMKRVSAELRLFSSSARQTETANPK